MTSPLGPNYLTVEEVAPLWNVHPHTVRRWDDDPEYDCPISYRWGRGKVRLFKRSEAIAYAQKLGIDPAPWIEAHPLPEEES